MFAIFQGPEQTEPVPEAVEGRMMINPFTGIEEEVPEWFLNSLHREDNRTDYVYSSLDSNELYDPRLIDNSEINSPVECPSK